MRDNPLPVQAGLPSISLLLAVYNEEKIIIEKLENIRNMDFPKEKIEILIGSDGSSDRTSKLIQSFDSVAIRLFHFGQRRGKAAVLNDLSLVAKNEILVFSDANTFYAPDALSKMVRHFADPEIGGVCGNLHLSASARNSGGKGEAAYWRYENSIKECEGEIKTTFGATGGIYALRRNLYRQLPTDKAVMDDFLLPLFAVRQGFRVVYDALARGWEDTTSSTANEFKRKIRIGAANFSGMVEVLPLLHPKHGFIAFGLFSHKLIRWIIPFLLITIFASSIILNQQGGLYRWIFIAQFVFACVASVGYILDKISRPVMLFTLPYYFVVANLGLLVGFIRFVKGTQKAAWSSTRT
jgi:cellulose synthase/poly-beta-1,6-N-acetylglucosamine synthase-like glycosyltransferase